MANQTKKPSKTPAIILIAAAGIWILTPNVILYYIFGSFSTIMSFLAWGLLIVGLIWLYSINKNSKKIKNSYSEGQRIQQKDYDLWNSLGNTQSEREESINKLFDENKSTITFGERYNFKDRGADGKVQDYFIQFRISRNLATMQNREKEFLRTTFLLFNEQLINDRAWNYYRFAFINGDGKASIEEFGYSVPHKLATDHHIKDGISMIKYWNVLHDASVDSAVNFMLQLIGDLEGNNSKSVTKITRRIQGNNSWLSKDEIKGTIFDGKNDYQLGLGNLEDTDTMLSYSGEGSLITIAPPGSGKTQCFVIPNMLSWAGAAVVLDIKGEIYESTHKWREKNVGKTYKFSPLDPYNSSSYNPLTFIRQDPDFLWEDSRFLADMMIVPSGASDPFWENMARDVLTSAIAYVCFENESDDREMSKVLDLIYGIGWDEMIDSLKTNFLVRAMRQTGHSLDGLETKQRDTILKTAQSSLSAWQGERIAKVTTSSDWSPLDLRAGSPTIYICINPNEIESYLSVIRVFIAQHIRMLTSELPERGAPPVLFMLDELPRLKRMPPIEEALSLGRQYGIKLWMFAQSYGQIKEAYPDPEGLLGSCVIRTFMNLPINDEITTKISNQLGYKHDALGNGKEKLVEPIELSGPNYKDLILVLSTSTKPARLKKKFAFQDPQLLEKING